MLRININTAPILKSIDNLIDAIDMLIMKADEDLEEELKAEGYVATGEAVETLNALEDGWTEAYNDHCDDLLEQLQSALEVDDFIEKKWPKIRDSKTLRDAIYEIFKDRFLGLLEDCVTGFLAGDDPDLLTDGMEILSEPAKKFVEGWSGQLADLMHLSTNDQIESILLQGQKEHLSVMQVATNISNSKIRDPGYKARRAAMTEVLRAESYGQLEAMKQNPAIMEKEWQHTGMHKNKPRPNHVAISGQRKPVNEPFDLTGADGGSYQPMCPRDVNLPAGESINCHCLMKSIRDPNWKNLSVEERRALREQRMAEMEDDDIEIATDTYTGEKAVPYSERGIEIEERLQNYLAKLEKDGDYITDASSSVSLADLSVLSTETGVEFSLFDVGDTAYLVRGEELGTTITEGLQKVLKEKHGTLRAHSHPFIGDLIPSMRDRHNFQILKWQKDSVIIDPTGKAMRFTADGAVEAVNVENAKSIEMYIKLFGDE